MPRLLKSRHHMIFYSVVHLADKTFCDKALKVAKKIFFSRHPFFAGERRKNIPTFIRFKLICNFVLSESQSNCTFIFHQVSCIFLFLLLLWETIAVKTKVLSQLLQASRRDWILFRFRAKQTAVWSPPQTDDEKSSQTPMIVLIIESWTHGCHSTRVLIERKIFWYTIECLKCMRNTTRGKVARKT